MFGVRWLNQYQHSFDRKGKADMSLNFRAMEEEEFKRNWLEGHHVLVEGLVNQLEGKSFPQPIGSTTSEDDVNYAADFKYWKDERVTFVRGEGGVPRFQSTACDVRQGYDDNSLPSDDNGETPMEKTVLSRTAGTSTMFDADEKFRISIAHTQEQQKLEVERLLNTNLSKHSITQTIMRETLKVVENHQDLYEMYVKDLKELELKFTRMVVKENESGAFSSSSLVSTVIDNSITPVKKRKKSTLQSAHTGRSNKKKEKRLTLSGY